jgi:hypothetical protein
MAGAPAVMTLVVTLRSLLPAVAALARVSALLAATERTLSNVATLAHLLLPLLLHEKQLVIYARWWQCVILYGAVLRHSQPAAGIFSRQLRQLLGNFNHDGHLREVLRDNPQ